jgi:pimeloyl-ACP methyl ester carboxylesterase
MLRSSPVDGFRLASERAGAGPAVVLLHGWPVDRADYRAVTPLLSDRADVVVPDLRGFGTSDKHLEDPAVAYSADAQARSVLGLMDELGLAAPVIAGYDIGSHSASTGTRRSTSSTSPPSSSTAAPRPRAPTSATSGRTGPGRRTGNPTPTSTG